jgi:hypothetical protein
MITLTSGWKMTITATPAFASATRRFSGVVVSNSRLTAPWRQFGTWIPPASALSYCRDSLFRDSLYSGPAVTAKNLVSFLSQPPAVCRHFTRTFAFAIR